MSKKYLPTIIFIIVAFIIVISVTLIVSSTYTLPTDQVSSTTPAKVESIIKTYTMSQIGMHTNAQSCWTTINGGVYELTEWIDNHPGGAEAILSICGKDGTAAFNGQHDKQERPANELAGFKIGTLAE